jgi:thymidylate synthase ThyX
VYEDTCRFLLDTYTRLMDPVTAAIRAETPRRERQTERAHEGACRAKACDVLRYILPAATLTNIGMTINGRLLEHLITKLLSHPLAECQRVGTLLKAEAEQVIPTLIKYAGVSDYLRRTADAMESVGRAHLFGVTPAKAPAVALVRYPADAEDQLVSAVLYGYVAHPLAQIEECVRTLSTEEKARIIDEYLKRRGPHDQPLRALEHLTYTFDILVDFGAFRDIQRHRMITQTPQESTAVHGYSSPPEMTRYGSSAAYDECMTRARAAYEAIARDFPHEAQYVLPLAFRKRVLFTWNLREIHHFVQLRSGRQGHISYRRIAQQVFREVERVHPLLAKYIRVDLEDYSLARL